MKIAVASTDGVAMSSHFGQSKCFIVFEAAEGKVINREVRDNRFTAHAQGQCQGHTAHDHDHAQPHSHADVVNGLRDCQVILCGGMGWRAAEELKANGIQPFVLEVVASPEEAVAAFLAGKVKAGVPFCRCHE